MRTDFPTVKPVIYNRVRYDVAENDEYGQFGGIIGAFDVSTGDELWDLLVYKVDFEIGLERDATDILITSLSLSDDKKSLIVTNEIGNQFKVNLETRQVEPPNKIEKRSLIRNKRTGDIQDIHIPSEAVETPPDIDQDLLKEIMEEGKKSNK